MFTLIPIFLSLIFQSIAATAANLDLRVPQKKEQRTNAAASTITYDMPTSDGVDKNIEDGLKSHILGGNAHEKMLLDLVYFLKWNLDQAKVYKLKLYSQQIFFMCFFLKVVKRETVIEEKPQNIKKVMIFF